MHQALFFLYRVDDAFRQDLDNLSENGQRALLDVNTQIGHLLMLKADPAKAYSYLDVGRRSGDIIAESHFVDCLCLLKHPYAENAIKDILSSLLSQINNTENNDSFITFSRFLNRRLVYVYRYKGRYADAELILNRMLANGEDDPQYIKDELAEINKEKEQANQENDNPSKQ